MNVRAVLSRVVRYAGAAILLVTTVIVAAAWRHIPAQIPSHFDAAGRIDAYGDKSSLIVLLVIGWFVYAALALRGLVTRHSRRESPDVLRIIGLMLDIMSLTFSAGLSYMILCTAFVRPLGVWFLPVFLLAVFLPMAVCIAGVVRKKYL